MKVSAYKFTNRSVSSTLQRQKPRGKKEKEKKKEALSRPGSFFKGFALRSKDKGLLH